MSSMVEAVSKYEHQGSMISRQKRVKWVKHYWCDHRILLVGDGDFSFSLSLGMAFGDASNIVATSIDSYDVVIEKYKEAKRNLEMLFSLGAQLLHGVDAFRMKLHTDLQMRKFDRIIYNFPHAGFLGLERNHRVIMMHRNLVCGFFKNASGMLRPKGEVHVSHKTSHPFKSWNVEELATRNSLTLLECIKFRLKDYPGYNNKRGDGKRSDEPFPLGENYEHQGSMISRQKRVKWVKHYWCDHRILLVGDGDFSFSLSLAMAFGDASNIVATSLDSYDVVIKKYKAAKTNLEILHSLGAELLHEVDAFQMKLHTNLQMRKFDRIIYNFPHAGFLGGERDKRVITLHRNLVCGFLKNASGMLNPTGEVHVTHKTSHPFDSWNIEELAAQNSLTLLERVDFKLEDYPGYNNKRGDGKRADEPFPLGECSTYKFVLFPKRNSSKKDGLCYCKPPLRVVEHTSWSKNNPNRRFMGCPKYRGPESEHCKSIEWIDPPLTEQRYKEAMYKLRHERDEKEAAIEALLEEMIRKEKLMETLKTRIKEIDADKEKLVESLTRQRNEKEATIEVLLEEMIRTEKLLEALKSRNEEFDLYKNGMNKVYKRGLVISVVLVVVVSFWRS